MQRVNDGSDNISQSVVKRYEIWDKNFVRIDNSLFNLGLNDRLNVAFLKGYDQTGNILESDSITLQSGMEKQGQPLYFQGCQWKCVGENYAYAIQQYRNYSNPDYGHYSITPTFNYENEDTGARIPYYKYFNEDNIVTYTSDFAIAFGNYDYSISPITGDTIWAHYAVNRPAFHGLSSWMLEDEDPPEYLTPYLSQAPRFYVVNQYDANNLGWYTDNGVAILTPTVYVLQKYTGWWRSGGFRSPSLQNGSTPLSGHCQYDLSFAIDQMNMPNSSIHDKQDNVPYPITKWPLDHLNVPDLFCYSDYSGGGSGSGYGLTSLEFWNCLFDEGYYETLIDYIEGGGDWQTIFDIADASAACSGIFDNGSVDDFVVAVEYFSLIHIGVNDDNVISFTHSDIIDADGQYIPQPDVTIDPGLYTLNYKLPGMGIVNLTFETKQKLSSSLDQSDFVDATIFPVPLVDDYEFNMHLSASATSSFRYELWDLYGNVLYTKNYEILAGHDKDHVVKTSQPIPDGVLINRFIFRDGSSFSITTTKQ